MAARSSGATTLSQSVELNIVADETPIKLLTRGIAANNLAAARETKTSDGERLKELLKLPGGVLPQRVHLIFFRLGYLQLSDQAIPLGIVDALLLLPSLALVFEKRLRSRKLRVQHGAHQSQGKTHGKDQTDPARLHELERTLGGRDVG